METMEIIKIVNAFCNCVIALSVTAFIVFVYGRSGTMAKLPKWEQTTIKVGLITIACGSLFNFLTMSVPPITEVILNIGLSIIFAWACIFHYNYFIKQSKNKKDGAEKQ